MHATASDGINFPFQLLPPRPLTPEQRARLFDPLANARAALSIYRDHDRARRLHTWPTASERSDNPRPEPGNAPPEPPQAPSRARARATRPDGPPRPPEPGERLPGCWASCVPTTAGYVVHALGCPNGVWARRRRELGA